MKFHSSKTYIYIYKIKFKTKMAVSDRTHRILKLYISTCETLKLFPFKWNPITKQVELIKDKKNRLLRSIFLIGSMLFDFYSIPFMVG